MKIATKPAAQDPIRAAEAEQIAKELARYHKKKRPEKEGNDDIDDRPEE